MRVNRNVVYWLCQIAGWTVYSATNVLFVVLFQPDSLQWQTVASNFALGGVGFGATHALRAFAKRRHWIELPLLRLVPRVLLCAVLIAAFMTLSIFLYWSFTPAGPNQDLMPSVLIVMMFNFSIMGFLWQVLYFGVQYFQRYQNQKFQSLRMELAAQEAQLRALRSQMNPHFLFNCLNSLRALISEDPRAAQEMVTRLSSLLRHVLQSDRISTVPLSAEMEAVEDYLALERIRFEERLRPRYDISAQARAAHIPPMLIQTLAENAVKHGISQAPSGGELRISASITERLLHIEVSNPGSLVRTGSGTRLGLDNVRERLRLLYGDRAALTLDEREERVVAHVHLPIQRAEEAV